MIDAAQINTPCAAYKKMACEWELIHDLKGGTTQMRYRAQKWLPQEQGEKLAQYQARLLRTFLYNGLQKAIDELLAKPFTKLVTIKDKPPGLLDRIEANVDREGTDLTQFASALLEDMMTHGLTHVLIDSPANPGANSEEQERDDIRPYFVHVKADAVIGWRSVVVNGRRMLSDVRIRECATEPDGAFGERETKRVKRWWRDERPNAAPVIHWEIWAEGERGQWAIASQGVVDLVEIPLVTIYAKKTGFMTATPPLRDIADLNLAHWQSQSDQRNILRFIRAGVMHQTQVPSDEMDRLLPLGAGAVVKTKGNGTLAYVEHSGAGAGAGRQDLVDLKDEMASLALQPLMQSPGQPTATGKAIDESRTNSLIKRWIRALETGLRDAYGFAAAWAGVELPREWPGVDIFDDFGLSVRAAEDIRALAEMRRDRNLSQRTYLAEVKRRGLVSDTLDVDAEIEALAEEGAEQTAAIAAALEKAEAMRTAREDAGQTGDDERGSASPIPQPGAGNPAAAAA